MGTTNQRGGIGLYNKPYGCSTSVALATGPDDDDDEEEEEEEEEEKEEEEEGASI